MFITSGLHLSDVMIWTPCWYTEQCSQLSSGNLTLLLCSPIVLYTNNMLDANLEVVQKGEGSHAPQDFPSLYLYSLIAPDAMLVEREMVKKSFGNLTLLFCQT